MRRIICRLAVVCAVLGVPLSAVARDVYVAKEGDDANPGTKEKPLASIPKAVEAMRGAIRNAGGKSDLQVYPDAGHAFHADYRPSYRKEAAQDGWRRLAQWFLANGV